MTWRYSVGNTYEELSFSEALDVAEVMGGYGYEDIAKAILRFTLRRLPERFSSRRRASASSPARSLPPLPRSAYVREETPELAPAVGRLGREIDRPGGTGLLNREAALERHRAPGLRPARPDRRLGRPAGDGRVWAQTGYSELSARCRTLAARLGQRSREFVAVRAAAPGPSLFVPFALLDGHVPSTD